MWTLPQNMSQLHQSKYFVTVKKKKSAVNLQNRHKFHLRDSDLRGGVVVEAEGTTLQDLEAKTLTRISIYIH